MASSDTASKRNQRVVLYERYAKVLPETDVIIGTRGFDTQVLAAVEAELPPQQGTDCQHSLRYRYDKLRGSYCHAGPVHLPDLRQRYA